MFSFYARAADEEPASTCAASQDTTTTCANNKSPALQTEPPKDVSGGFLIFALAMGRYGNQMEHLLGALAEAKRRAPSRIVVLPSFIVWRYGRGRRNAHIPVEAVFDLDALRRDFHPNIVSYEEFQNIARWNSKGATIYCNSAHKAMDHFKCTPDVGQGTYWYALGIKFSKEHYFHNTVFNLSSKDHPVIIVSNALSAAFPMRPQDRYVAKYLKWTDRMEERRQTFLAENGISEDDIVVATHLRAGSDWVKACKHAVGRDTYMASPQCSEEMRRHNMYTISLELCLPTVDVGSVASDLQTAAEQVNKRSKKKGGRVVLFIAKDVPGIGEKIWSEYSLGNIYELLISTAEPAGADTDSDGVDALMGDLSFLDLNVMTHADYLLGNCVSSFTSFAARIRTEQGIGLGTEFFGLL